MKIMRRISLLFFGLIIISFTKAHIPVADFTLSGTSCAVYSLQIVDLSTNSPTAWSYTMSGGTPSISSSQNPTVSFSLWGTYSISLVATNVSGSSPVITKTIAIGSATTSAANTGPYCVGTAIQLNTVAFPTTNAYSWTGPYGFTSNLQNPIISNATMTMTGVYIVTLTIGTCTSMASTSVSVTPLPIPAFFYNLPVCDGQPLTLVGSGGTTYTWSGPSSFSSNSSSVTISSVSLSNSGTYSLAVTSVMPFNSCTNVAVGNIIVNPSPTITATSNSSLICGPPFQQTVILTANGASTYTWNTSAIGNTISVTPSVTTTYSVTGTDLNGCDNSTIFTQSVSACTSANEVINMQFEFNISPNPSNGIFIIDCILFENARLTILQFI